MSCERDNQWSARRAQEKRQAVYLVHLLGFVHGVHSRSDDFLSELSH